MRASELRIGNFVYRNNTQRVVEEIHNSSLKVNNDNTLWNLKKFKPVPLTEEWLEKFWFKVTKGKFIDETYAILNTKDVIFEYWLDGDMYINGMTEESLFVPKEIKHVHQLQNLYFALTGEELKIKDND